MHDNVWVLSYTLKSQRKVEQVREPWKPSFALAVTKWQKFMSSTPLLRQPRCGEIRKGTNVAPTLYPWRNCTLRKKKHLPKRYIAFFFLFALRFQKAVWTAFTILPATIFYLATANQNKVWLNWIEEKRTNEFKMFFLLPISCRSRDIKWALGRNIVPSSKQRI